MLSLLSLLLESLQPSQLQQMFRARTAAKYQGVEQLGIGFGIIAISTMSYRSS